MKEQEIIITTGIPCSGKSTWSKQYVKDNPTYVRVNRDELRRMRGIYWLVSQEDMITENELDCINNALVAGYNVVIDATNFNPKTIKKFEDLIAERTQKCHGEIKFKITYKHFDINLDEAISRDMGRPKEEQVGAAVITSMYNKYIVAKNILNIKTDKMVQDPNLPHVTICDLDGTLCISNGRDIFDYSKVDTDLPNKPVLEIVRNYLLAGKGEVIFMSGREDYCKEKSINWLKKHMDRSVLWDSNIKLFMRKTGDHRKDCVVKKEIFDEEIKGKYYVDFCLEDRDQMVKLYRDDLGLTCLQVNWGNF